MTESLLMEARALQLKIDSFTVKVKEILANPNISLDDKEKILRNTDIDISHGWMLDIKKLDGTEVCWYDDFYIERRETAYITDIIDQARDKVVDEEWTKEEADHIIKELLNSGYTNFVYDW